MDHAPAALGAAVLLAAAPAIALPTQLPYEATIGGAPVGTVSFDLDQEVANACRYGVTWAFAPLVPSEQCFVDELTTPANRTCFLAALRPLPTFVTLPPPGVPCQGIDATGQSTPVFALAAAEQANGALDGVIQLDSASTDFLSFHAEPFQEGPPAGANVVIR
jgi:hypothetical protein